MFKLTSYQDCIQINHKPVDQDLLFLLCSDFIWDKVQAGHSQVELSLTSNISQSSVHLLKGAWNRIDDAFHLFCSFNTF